MVKDLMTILNKFLGRIFKGTLDLAAHNLKSVRATTHLYRKPVFKVNIRFLSAMSIVENGQAGKQPEKKPFRRLPTNVVPSNYEITLQPDLKNFTFKGNEIIDLQVKSSTKQITMNCVDINISDAAFTNLEDSSDVNSANIKYNKDAETVTIVFSSALPSGSGKLSIGFTGELNDKMKGFYRSKYKDLEGVEKYCAVTQFEATDARRAFPCWDEPAVKATFDIRFIVPKSGVALSNMNVIEEEDYKEDENMRVMTFARTPIMSTYLLAFVVGEFDFVESQTEDGIQVRVYTPLGKAEQGQFALQVATKTLPFYKEYFGIGYPLPKMDLIAIPDFAAGAMENWGLVTYRETALLVDSEQSSAAMKQWVALVVGHETAHQWFGNLVTMEWWTHLWLNEGFASWIEYLCVDHCFPEYDIWTQFVTNDYVRAQELDALKNSHPIEVEVGHPSEVDEIFDAISYSKGASVIRMLHEYIGDNDFKAGLHSYLTKYSYKNASTGNLWDSLAAASKKPVADIMNTWTKQMGFPVLNVSMQVSENLRILQVSQSKFSADGSKTEGDDKYKWLVPITICTSENPSHPTMKTLLTDKEMVIFVKNVAENHWLKLNPGQICFYRVNYSSEMLDALIPAINDHSLQPIDRLGIQNDIFALTQAGLKSTVDYLRVLEGFKSETNYTVWNDVLSNLSKLGTLLQYTPCHKQFKTFCVSLLSEMGETVGWEKKDGEGHLTALLRSLVISVLGHNGHDATIEECRRRFEAHCKEESLIPADLRGAIYGNVIMHGDESTLEAMIDLYMKSDHQEEKVRLMRSMGASEHEHVIERALKFAMSDDVRPQDTVFAVAGCTHSVQGRWKTWNFVKDNWEEFHKRYEGGFLLSRLIKSSTSLFASEDMAKDVEDFFTKNKAEAAERTIQQSLENIRVNKNWLARDETDIKSWLDENY
eukprot:gene17827-19608_t